MYRLSCGLLPFKKIPPPQSDSPLAELLENMTLPLMLTMQNNSEAPPPPPTHALVKTNGLLTLLLMKSTCPVMLTTVLNRSIPPPPL